MSNLSSTARVILGLLKFAPRTGYDVKRVTDISTRFFWRASYGQIYPELHTLADAGLVRARNEPHGRRRRLVYELTSSGERAFREWLAGTGELYEVRDEGLLRLFFGELMTEADLLALVRRRRAWFEGAAENFHVIEAELGDLEGPSAAVLRYGIELMDWNAAWWADLEQRIVADRVG
jgi:PadR family transcriptional regulator, regulatory protein AphA